MKKTSLFLLVIFTSLISTAQKPDVTISFKSAAKNFTESLPLANGRLRALVYDNSKNERVAVNKISLWSGGVQGWKLIFQEEFNGTGSFDTSKWSFCQRGNPAWAKYLTDRSDYAYLSGGNLVLRMDEKILSGDSVPYHSGGIKTQGKFRFRYGKVEVRARFNRGKGSWPAIWMMPEKDNYGGWPCSGEIDIMEHVNNEDIVHLTIHNAAVTDASGGSTASKTAAYNPDAYNLYGMIWTMDKIEFYLNNTLYYTYRKAVNATHQNWPFDQPFYLILNQSGGAGWPGSINNNDLPFSMSVDWVRVYQAGNFANAD